MSDESQKEYEIAFLLSSLEAEKDLEGALRQNHAEFTYQKSATEQHLAYPIKKHNSAYFGFYNFKTEPANIKLIKDALALNANVLRFMIITPPVKIASAAPQARPEKKPAAAVVSNQALEEKLEEILK
ncbi:MAG: 30S ribosomal protein S6 [Parcubacteria group bacterium GW2011_GWA2_47_8b]|uniref:Small ribosomal subunit protein bS6 n=2 Tax=Parcubacteria group TaxID=1794811 RepID=A0A0G1T5X9_9BACT|nr:MAG: 30S ribosomal protein S6 [Candidatus Giovannonibacteria bacterium GW2011_GWB1_47_6b]KKU85271.1 MAG: 30S ribosomal protein S6 [Parcubacteria group bacterium GW2011_GWA2_47_8b]KKU94951.1 MAG: 30S ribosomal protein S6 [Parcubacteria group bacterium GW2011_GWA1_48_11b]OGY64066.1 MAG: 30S ribosomal protein S6 [Candidatus Harrisonbacteria bacterium RIFCSPHIGHO2_12_FULL_48_16]